MATPSAGNSASHLCIIVYGVFICLSSVIGKSAIASSQHQSLFLTLNQVEAGRQARSLIKDDRVWPDIRDLPHHANVSGLALCPLDPHHNLNKTHANCNFVVAASGSQPRDGLLLIEETSLMEICSINSNPSRGWDPEAATTKLQFA